MSQSRFSLGHVAVPDFSGILPPDDPNDKLYPRISQIAATMNQIPFGSWGDEQKTKPTEPVAQQTEQQTEQASPKAPENYAGLERFGGESVRAASRSFQKGLNNSEGYNEWMTGNDKRREQEIRDTGINPDIPGIKTTLSHRPELPQYNPPRTTFQPTQDELYRKGYWIGTKKPDGIVGKGTRAAIQNYKINTGKRMTLNGASLPTVAELATMSRDEVIGVQRALSLLGFKIGKIDGIAGKKTKGALAQVNFQVGKGTAPGGITGGTGGGKKKTSTTTTTTNTTNTTNNVNTDGGFLTNEQMREFGLNPDVAGTILKQDSLYKDSVFKQQYYDDLDEKKHFFEDAVKGAKNGEMVDLKIPDTFGGSQIVQFPLDPREWDTKGFGMEQYFADQYPDLYHEMRMWRDYYHYNVPNDGYFDTKTDGEKLYESRSQGSEGFNYSNVSSEETPNNIRVGEDEQMSYRPAKTLEAQQDSIDSHWGSHANLYDALLGSEDIYAVRGAKTLFPADPSKWTQENYDYRELFYKEHPKFRAAYEQYFKDVGGMTATKRDYKAKPTQAGDVSPYAEPVSSSSQQPVSSSSRQSAPAAKPAAEPKTQFEKFLELTPDQQRKFLESGGDIRSLGQNDSNRIGGNQVASLSTDATNDTDSQAYYNSVDQTGMDYITEQENARAAREANDLNGQGEATNQNVSVNTDTGSKEQTPTTDEQTTPVAEPVEELAPSTPNQVSQQRTPTSRVTLQGQGASADLPPIHKKVGLTTAGYGDYRADPNSNSDLWDNAGATGGFNHAPVDPATQIQQPAYEKKRSLWEFITGNRNVPYGNRWRDYVQHGLMGMHGNLHNEIMQRAQAEIPYGQAIRQAQAAQQPADLTRQQVLYLGQIQSQYNRLLNDYAKGYFNVPGGAEQAIQAQRKLLEAYRDNGGDIRALRTLPTRSGGYRQMSKKYQEDRAELDNMQQAIDQMEQIATKAKHIEDTQGLTAAQAFISSPENYNFLRSALMVGARYSVSTSHVLNNESEANRIFEGAYTGKAMREFMNFYRSAIQFCESTAGIGTYSDIDYSSNKAIEDARKAVQGIDPETGERLTDLDRIKRFLDVGVQTLRGIFRGNSGALPIDMGSSASAVAVALNAYKDALAKSPPIDVGGAVSLLEKGLRTAQSTVNLDNSMFGLGNTYENDIHTYEGLGEQLSKYGSARDLGVGGFTEYYAAPTKANVVTKPKALYHTPVKADKTQANNPPVKRTEKQLKSQIQGF